LILVEIRDQSGLDWGGIGLVLGAERGGNCREDGADVASLLLRIGIFGLGRGNNCAQLMGTTTKRLRRLLL
jgi:hypothetical protein